MAYLSLREARKKSGLKAAEVAEIYGVNRTQLYRVESGEYLTHIEVCHRIRAYWTANQVPDLAIYDPKEFERRRAPTR